MQSLKILPAQFGIARRREEAHIAQIEPVRICGIFQLRLHCIHIPDGADHLLCLFVSDDGLCAVDGLSNSAVDSLRQLGLIFRNRRGLHRSHLFQCVHRVICNVRRPAECHAHIGTQQHGRRHRLTHYSNILLYLVDSVLALGFRKVDQLRIVVAELPQVQVRQLDDPDVRGQLVGLDLIVALDEALVVCDEGEDAPQGRQQHRQPQHEPKNAQNDFFQ